jgi:hypothetical protein
LLEEPIEVAKIAAAAGLLAMDPKKSDLTGWKWQGNFPFVFGEKGNKEQKKRKKKQNYAEKERKRNILNGNGIGNGWAVSDGNGNGKEIPEKQIWKLSRNISGLGPCKEALHLHDKTRSG